MQDILNFISAMLTMIGIGFGVKLLLGRHKIKVVKPEEMQDRERRAEKRRKNR